MEACNQGVERANTAITTPYFDILIDILKGEYYENILCREYVICKTAKTDRTGSL
jgi:hypothetical protein